MNVLLINPWVYENDIIRANRIVKMYSKEYVSREPVRKRHNAVIYTNEDYSSPVAAWHSTKRITLHFGEPRDQESSR